MYTSRTDCGHLSANGSNSGVYEMNLCCDYMIGYSVPVFAKFSLTASRGVSVRER